MTEYVCIYASGIFVPDIVKVLIERNLAVKADLLEVFPMYFKNNKVKTGSNNNAVMLLVERARLDEAMNTIQSLNQWNDPLIAYAMPVLASIGI